jgi:dihydroorotate dehydrogenase
MDHYRLIRPLLFRLEPEAAHSLTLALLRAGLGPRIAPVIDPALRVTLWNRAFPNPVGLAAGFDKDAAAIGPLFNLGFGFVEAGTVTPRPQRGNPKPRIFRDPPTRAIINRMGFPNRGLTQFKGNLEKFLSGKARPAGLVGINIGMNREQREPARDYCLLVKQLAPFADYITVNISSPNTPGLRDLQERGAFMDLIGRIMEERRASGGIDPPPLLVKLAPDLDEAQQEALAQAALASGVDGLILANTTRARPRRLPRHFAKEPGGLSGAPLRSRATALIRNFYRLTEGRLPLVGVGGIASGSDAYEKIRAGATLVQLYSGLVFGGPGMVRDINTELLECLRRDGFSHVGEAVGADHRQGTDEQRHASQSKSQG